MDDARLAAGFWRRFGVLFGFGVFGVLALIPMIAPVVRSQIETLPPTGLPFEVLLVLSTINPLLLLAVAVAVGVRLAPRVGLRSLIDERTVTGEAVIPRLAPHLPTAIGWGVAAGATILIIDILTASYVGSLAQAEAADPGWLAALVGGMLYGGITEELMVRWGLMSFLAWAGWRLLARGGARASDGIMWGAIIGSAVAFGIGHLPVAAATATLTPLLVLRVISLNAIGGIVFGWLFWRRNLEVAMVAHASVHLVFAAGRLIG